jgi:phosphoglycolate phosphatase
MIVPAAAPNSRTAQARPYTRPVIAVLDLAGTTVADPGIIEHAVRTALELTAGTVPDDFPAQFAAARGSSKRQMFTAFLGPSQAEEAHALFESLLYQSVRSGDLQPLPGATQALRALRRAGSKIALTTGFSQPVRQTLLESLNWNDLVDLTLSPEDAGRGRPWPDLPLTALLRLDGIDVRQLAVVGDTANDLLAGHRAGASIVAGVLTGAHDRARLSQAPHTHILPSITEFAELIQGGVSMCAPVKGSSK